MQQQPGSKYLLITGQLSMIAGPTSKKGQPLINGAQPALSTEPNGLHPRRHCPAERALARHGPWCRRLADLHWSLWQRELWLARLVLRGPGGPRGKRKTR